MTANAGGTHFSVKSDSAAIAWPRQIVRLALIAALLVALFHRDMADIVRIWLTSDPYSHCIYLPPIIGWLVWQRKDALAALTPGAWPIALLVIAAGSGLWLIGSASGVALFRHAGVVVMAQGIVLTLLGPAVGRALMFPLGYAFFLIPLGSEAEPVLQVVTAHMAMVWLGIMGIPATLDGIFITTPNGFFRVAEACSGTGFLIAMAAFAVLAAHLCFKSWPRRILFVAGAMIACFLANGVRAAGIIYFAYHHGVESAVVVDHVVYGWFFFAAVIVLVMAAGWRFFDRGPADGFASAALLQGIAASPYAGRVPVSVLCAMLIALPAGWLSAISAASSGQPVPPSLTLPQPAGWTPRIWPVGTPWSPHFAGASATGQQQYVDRDGAVVDLAIVAFDRQEEGRELVGFGQGAASPDGQGEWMWAQNLPPRAGAKVEVLRGPGREGRLAYTWYVMSGQTYAKATDVKLATLRQRLVGGDPRAVAIVASAPREHADALDRFTIAMGDPKTVADRALQSQ